MSGMAGHKSAPTSGTRGLLSELVAFARAHRKFVLLLLLGPSVIFYVSYIAGVFPSANVKLVPWRSDTLRFNTMEELIQHRFKSDPELERLRAIAGQHKAAPPPPPLATSDSVPGSPHLILVGGTYVPPPSTAGPDLVAEIRSVLIDPDVELSDSRRPSLAALVSGVSSFHDYIELIRSKLETLPQADIVVEYSLWTERCALGIARPEESCPPPNAGGRKRDFQELAFLGNGRFFGAVAIFPLLNSPFTANHIQSLHQKLIEEIESAGLRALDILTYVRSLDVEDFRTADSPTTLTPYGRRVYAHILAAYFECTRLIPTRVFVKDRSGCGRPRPAQAGKPPVKSAAKTPAAAAESRKKGTR